MYYLRKMQTLITPKAKLKIASFNSYSCQIKEKSKNSKLSLDFKFYQKLFAILFASCAFLIFPESPQDSESLCKKYHLIDACMIW